jgi:hypothetical protein
MQSIGLMATAAMDTVTEGLTGTAGQAGFTGSTLSTTSLIGNTINVVFGLLGIVTLGLIVYAGALYLISQGEKGAVEKAHKILTFSILGMVVIVSAFAISNYLLGALELILQ